MCFTLQNYDELYKELASTRAYYERSLEQISVLENNKQLAMQQLELAEHEKERLRQENDRLREVCDQSYLYIVEVLLQVFNMNLKSPIMFDSRVFQKLPVISLYVHQM